MKVDKEMEEGTAFEKMARQAAQAVAAIERDDAVALAALPDAAWWGAEARLGEKESLGLASWAIRKDAGSCMELILANPSWQAGRARSQQDLDKVRETALSWGIEKRSLDCVGRLAKHPGQAWIAAEKCAPVKAGSADTVGYHGRIETSRTRGWVEGFERALGIAVEQSSNRVLSEEEKRWASETLSRAVGREWREKSAFERGVLKVNEACEALMAGGKPEMFVLRALQSAARQPVGGQAKSWILAQKAGDLLGVDATVGLSSELGYAAPKKRLSCEGQFGGARLDAQSQPIALFEKEIDVLWAAAVEVEDLAGVAAVRAMVKSSQGKHGPRPQWAPSVSGMSHPMVKLWEVWDHSRKAGFALPKKPLEMAWTQFESSMKFWEQRIDPKTAKAWREQAGSVADDLRSGAVPGDFCGRMERPTIDVIESDLKGGLSPLAWVLGQNKALTESRFLALALAQSELGFSLDESLTQCRLVSGGVEVQGSWVAKAQAQVLALSVAQPDTARKSAAARL